MSNSKRVPFAVSKDQRGMLIREFLLDVHHISQKSLSQIKNKGKILWNGQEVTVRQQLSPGDQVVLVYPPEEVSQYLIPQPVPLNILWENQDLVAINKPPGLCVHPTKGHPENTLANGILYYLREKGDQGGFHAVNRLDMDTSGVVLVAKHKYAKQQLFLQQQHKQVTRSYLALVQGVLENSGTIHEPIQKIDGKTTRREIHLQGQQACTHYQVISSGKDHSLVSIWLETGRTHQIRIHMASMGHPLVGDSLYGGQPWGGLTRQALHAARMTFFLPGTNQQKMVEAPLTEDMAKAVKNL